MVNCETGDGPNDIQLVDEEGVIGKREYPHPLSSGAEDVRVATMWCLLPVSILYAVYKIY